eukprot:1669087-Amphidinium_carterae.2
MGLLSSAGYVRTSPQHNHLGGQGEMPGLQTCNPAGKRQNAMQNIELQLSIDWELLAIASFALVLFKSLEHSTRHYFRFLRSQQTAH